MWLPKPKLIYCKSDPKEYILVKFESKHNYFLFENVCEINDICHK